MDLFAEAVALVSYETEAMIRYAVAGATGLTAQIVRDNEDLPRWIVCFDVLEQLDGVLGMTRSRTSGQFFAIADPQGSIDPHLVITTTVFQGSFDAMPIRRPPRGWREGARGYRSELISADGRRSRWRLGGVGDDRSPFGTRVFVIAGSPTVSMAPALAFAEVHTSDLAPFDLDTRGMGRVGEGIQAPLG
ncbi:hypothetical protein KSC_103530 [Ktedonobacter sp. SOSP1-52]|nr:hypothetical protein KSC_103530 [Ktedonobacter sp. SOSP1-52]